MSAKVRLSTLLVLFSGRASARIAYYNNNENLLDSHVKKGAYNILFDDFVAEILAFRCDSRATRLVHKYILFHQ